MIDTPALHQKESFAWVNKVADSRDDCRRYKGLGPAVRDYGNPGSDLMRFIKNGKTERFKISTKEVNHTGPGFKFPQDSSSSMVDQAMKRARGVPGPSDFNV